MSNLELFQLIEKGDLNTIIEHLKDKNAEYINRSNSEEYYKYSYPLILACHINRFDIAKVLIEGGANVNDCDFDFVSPIEWSFVHDNFEFLKYIQGKGADINGQGYYWTPLGLATFYSRFEIIKYLVEAGVDINLAPTCHGDTPLINSIESKECDYNIVKYLLDNGADPNIKNNHNHSAIQEAERKGRKDIIELLLEYGSKDYRKSTTGTFELKTCEFDPLDLM